MSDALERFKIERGRQIGQVVDVTSRLKGFSLKSSMQVKLVGAPIVRSLLVKKRTSVPRRQRTEK